MQPISNSVSFGTINVQRDLAVGTVLATVKTPPGDPSTKFIFCNAQGWTSNNMVYGGGIATSVPNVYATNVPGVGIRASLYGVYPYNSPSTTSWWPAETTFLNSVPSTVELVKTGPVTSGMLNPGQVGVTFTNDDQSKIAYDISITQSKIIAIQCAISNPNINIHLDDVLGSNLKSPGTVAKPRDFDIGLQCDPDARINVMLTGVKNTDTSAVGVLQLSNAGNANVATGVGIQILYGNTPVEINKNMVLKTSAGGQETFTFRAQYYQTKSTVTTGSANATATLEITYQ